MLFRSEQDEFELIGGIRHGRTLGSPVAVLIKNTEWFRSDVWHEEMSPHPGATKKPLTQPRPGHADLVGMQKYDFVDARDVAAEPVGRVVIPQRVPIGYHSWWVGAEELG